MVKGVVSAGAGDQLLRSPKLFIENQPEKIAIQKNLNLTHSGRSPTNITTPLVILNLSDSSFNQTAGESLNTSVFVVVGSHVEECAHVVHLVC